MNRGPVAEIDLSALKDNLDSIKRIVQQRQIIAVVKADAYGHGSIEISRELEREGVTCLAVAYTGEAKHLRESGIQTRIMVLFDPHATEDYFDYNLIPVIYDVESAVAFAKAAQKRQKSIPVHVKIDTGMGRVGLNPDNAVDSIQKICELKGIELAGLLSHFSEADLSDRSYAIYQLTLFNTIRNKISAKLTHPIMSHMANSAAILSLEESFLDAVRPGLMLYGCSPFRQDFGLRPLMKVKTKILIVRKLPTGFAISYGRTFVTQRESRIAVIPVGYADGYNRLFSNNAEALIHGKRAPVVGRICMDLTMVDVTDIDNVQEGDEVVLLGRQGGETVTAYELSSRIDTIPYEIMTSLGTRASKEYTH